MRVFVKTGRSLKLFTILSLTAAALFAGSAWLSAEQIPVSARMGALHGFLLLRDENGKVIAAGDQENVAEGNNMRARLTFHFADGSIDDEEAVFSQRRYFRLIRDHHVQKGPSFPHPLDVTIDVPKGEVTWIEASKSGSETKHKHMDLPPDLVNGIVALTIQNFPRKASEMKASYLVIDSGPRVVHFVVTPDGASKTLLGGEERHASRYNVHIDIGGAAGMLASLFGKQPPDFKLWVMGDSLPVFVKMTGALYVDGPVWTMTLAAPAWPGEQ